ncbi:MAG: GntR family transcriptional regulator [Oscillospiraceae bacterium]|nr:GntR family transcriptional regulator [Oscillospiraceae bacterium]
MFTINYQLPTPVYKQLYENVIRLVSFGALKPNDKLPPVRTLAGELGINPNTVSKAYSMLENDGYIYSAVGRGSFISENFDNREAEKIEVKKVIKNNLQTAFGFGVKRDEVLEILDEVYIGGEGK